ncbi:MAG TPA: AIR synthase-related protein, partial [Orrella sp.]
NAKPEDRFENGTLGDAVMAPTRIYVKQVLAALVQFGLAIKGLAHITGGGLLDNVPRILQPGMQAQLHASAWPMPALFEWLQQAGGIDSQEMYRVFNCGIGMVLVVDAEQASAITTFLADQGEQVYMLGQIQACDSEAVQTVVA